MPPICQRCRSVNPHGATYCYQDGALLETPSNGAAPVDSGPINFGARPFAMPLVLPSGKACHNFIELALAFHNDTAVALDLLSTGQLEHFLAAQGRADLATASREAAKAPERRRGLDDFLGRLPGGVLTPARLRVEPPLLDVGTLRPGEDKRCELVLHNGGMRLLYGSVSCDDSPWLALGENRVRQRMLFQCSGRAVVPVRILGKQLRAQRKPQEAEILVESSGGTASVIVRVQVTIQPFPEGALAGALTPRELVDRAHAAPKEAAALIESGAVLRWYEANGWTYPVPGPTAVGIAAVQQLFEALGVVKAPRVELSAESIQLSGRPGEALEHVLAAITQENRAAVAHAVSDQPWLQVGPTIFRGRSAMLPLSVPGVPARPGETLTAQLKVTANGGQRFVVPVTLAVNAPAPAPAPAPGILVSAAPAKPRPKTAAAPRKPRRNRLAPIILVAAGVALGAGALWLLRGGSGGNRSAQPEALLTLAFQDDPKDDQVGAATLTFGLALAGDADPKNPGKRQRLISEARGRTNNTCYRVDGQDFLLGYEGGQWQTPGEAPADGKRPGRRSVWLHQAAPVAIIQDVAIVAGPQSRRPDTCLVRYTLENRDRAAHKVGLRFLLDTFIGSRDGGPFAVPGLDQLCDTSCDRKAADVPDFVQALEKDDLMNPGTVAQLTLRLGWRLEMPDRLTVGAWPDDKLSGLDAKAQANLTRWDVPVLSMKGPSDSAVAIYWEEKDLAPGARREIGFAYGLGALAAEKGQGRLALALGGSFVPGGEFTVSAYVKNQVAGERLSLVLPLGLSLVAGTEVKDVPALPKDAGDAVSLVSWRVKSAARDQAEYEVLVRSNTGIEQARTIKVQSDRKFE